MQKKKNAIGDFFRKIISCMVLGLFFGGCVGIGIYSVFCVTGISDGKIGQQNIYIEETESNSEAQGESDEIMSEDNISDAIDSQEENQQAEAETDTGITVTETVRTIATDVTDVVEEVMPSVVSIINCYKERTSYWGQDYYQDAKASGSGIIIGLNETELLIATNYHVIQDAEAIEVTFFDETVAEASTKGTDAAMDLAVIAIRLADLDAETRSRIAIAKLGDSDALTVGEPAIAIGNALGYGQSVTTGVVSALNRRIQSQEGQTDGAFIQTDAAINPGNSGGALLNMNGEVIGINSNKIGGGTIEGMGYAIPISAAKPILNELSMKETRVKVSEEKRGYLGITGINISNSQAEMYRMPKGVYINQIFEGTAAETFGLRKGDIIVKFEDTEIFSMEELSLAMSYYEAGEQVTLIIMRSGIHGYEAMELQVILGARDSVQ